MKVVWSALAFLLLVTGCEEGFQQENEDPTVPVAIACEGCSELVSKSTESCDRCGHATLASILAYKKEEVRKTKEAKVLKRERELALARSKIEEIERRWDEVHSAYGQFIGQATDLETLQSSITPFSGWVKYIGEDGRISWLAHYRDDKRDGLLTSWFRNGRKEKEVNWKGGVQDGLSTVWFESGPKKGEKSWGKGERDGFATSWYENGRKQSASSWKAGKLVSVNVWEPDGKKCKVSFVREGNGVWVEYFNGGGEIFRVLYKDGLKVEN